MSIPVSIDLLGTLGASRSVSIGPFAAEEIEVLDPIGGSYRCKTLIGGVLIEAVSNNVGYPGASNNPKELLYKNIDYTPGYSENHLSGGGVYKLIFSQPCKPESISFFVTDVRAGRALVVNTPDGQELGRIDGGGLKRNVTLPLTPTGKITEIDIHAVNNNVWFNGISLQVEI